MKNFILIILALTIVSCKKDKLVKNLSGDAYLVRVINQDRSRNYNGAIMDSSVWLFNNSSVEIRYIDDDLDKPTPRKFITTTFPYTRKKDNFTIGNSGNLIVKYSIKDISGNDFTANSELVNQPDLDDFISYFFKIN